MPLRNVTFTPDGVLIDADAFNALLNSSDRRLRLWAKQGGRCFYCGEVMMLSRRKARSVTVDHKIPKSRGGGRGKNLVAACQKCNFTKGAMTDAEFRKSFTCKPETRAQLFFQFVKKFLSRK